MSIFNSSANFLNSADRLLWNKIERCVTRLLNGNTTNNPTTNETHIRQDPIGPTQALPNKIDNQMNYALALDIERRPRLSQKGSSEIMLHDRKQAGEVPSHYFT